MSDDLDDGTACIDCGTTLQTFQGCCTRYVCCHCLALLRDDSRRWDNYRERGWLL